MTTAQKQERYHLLPSVQHKDFDSRFFHARFPIAFLDILVCGACGLYGAFLSFRRGESIGQDFKLVHK